MSVYGLADTLYRNASSRLRNHDDVALALTQIAEFRMTSDEVHLVIPALC